jgi:hypothetical protein
MFSCRLPISSLQNTRSLTDFTLLSLSLSLSLSFSHFRLRLDPHSFKALPSSSSSARSTILLCRPGSDSLSRLSAAFRHYSCFFCIISLSLSLSCSPNLVHSIHNSSSIPRNIPSFLLPRIINTFDLVSIHFIRILTAINYYFESKNKNNIF